MTRAVLVAALGVVLASALAPVRAARAHDFTPGVLSLVERAPGRFAYAWTAPVDSGVPVEVTVELPARCRRLGATRLDCGARGISGGEVVFRGLRDHRARVLVHLASLDGSTREWLVTGDSPRVSLEAPADRALLGWIRLGVEHIATGLDHLAFLLGLLLVAGLDRRAVLAVTAFTLAHSVTLALAALELVRLSPAPVEAVIAASVVLVAREALHEEPTWTRRAPWLVALVFGLVHGLGFASALRETGLPRARLLAPLLGFNVGVELGQLALVGLLLAGARLVASPPRWLRPAAAYAIGGAGAAWLLARVAAIVARAG